MKLGEICLKIAGRDSGKLCVITKVIDNTYVEIDGETRRKKCNVIHLESTGKNIDINEGISREEIKDAFKKHLKINLKDKKSKPSKERPKKQHKKKEIPKKVKKAVKKAIKKETSQKPEKKSE